MAANGQFGMAANTWALQSVWQFGLAAPESANPAIPAEVGSSAREHAFFVGERYCQRYGEAIALPTRTDPTTQHDAHVDGGLSDRGGGGDVFVGRLRDRARLEAEFRERGIHPLRDRGIAGVVGVKPVGGLPLRVVLHPVRGVRDVDGADAGRGGLHPAVDDPH